MPHVVVKLWPGPSEDQKARLAEAIVRSFVDTLHSSESSVSVAIEEVSPGEWMENVYRPEIAPNMARLYKKPGYDPF
ncbi:4-oxalocrotonate tautomerase [Trinickia violacea]|uniref:4-oxalocrotonate tautomerase n=1 Tax=Trinickia violacea TaxID=2571746 RepID=A0A4P8ILP9_9BURK|nr:tautomerase family protein [Trinickia violacea]QCP49838.1 4-oxalocrotonate tautomerase [Trinickia violacea]